MPERRQRITSKVGKTLSKTNGIAQNQVEGDPFDECRIQEFIEASCFNLRQFLMKNLLPQALSKMGSEENSMKLSPQRNGSSADPDLVVVSVVLNGKDEQSDEITRAVERLRKNGVTCAFFTMDDIRNGNKPMSAITNGYDAMKGPTCNGQFHQQQLGETETKNSELHQVQLSELKLNQLCTAKSEYSPEVLPFAKKVSSVSSVTDHTKSTSGLPNMPEKFSPKKRKPRKRKYFYWAKRIVKYRRSTLDFLASTNATTRRTPTRVKEKIPMMDEPHKGKCDIACSISRTPAKPISDSSFDVPSVSNHEKMSTNNARLSKGGSNSPSTTSTTLPIRIPLAKGIQIQVVQPSSISSQKVDNTTCSVAKKKRKNQTDLNLAKFCIGDRATKSIATERIKQCFVDETKKNVTKPCSNGASYVVRTSPRNKKSKIDETVFPSTIVTANNLPNSAEQNVQSFVLEMESRCQSTPKKRIRKTSLSPDITGSLTTKTKSSNKRSPDITDCQRSLSVLSRPICDYLSSVQDKPVPVQGIPGKGPLNQKLALDVTEGETMTNATLHDGILEEEIPNDDVRDLVHGLLQNVVEQLKLDEPNSDNSSAQSDGTNVEAFTASLGLLKVETEGKQTNETVNETSSSENSCKLLLVAPQVKAEGCIPCLATHTTKYSEDSLPDNDVMQLRRSSFFSLIAGNVRTNMENYLDGRKPEGGPVTRRRRVPKNGFLLHHGDNCPEDPESVYKFHLATQVLLKLNRRRSKCAMREERAKTLLSYLKLTPKRSVRTGKSNAKISISDSGNSDAVSNLSTFSGDWTISRKYICGVCGQIEFSFWDMVTHKGELHPGAVVTHVELPNSQDPPESLIRKGPLLQPGSGLTSTACTKCSTSFSSSTDLHRHIFECAGNTSWLVEKAPAKRKSRRRRGFKRRLSNTPRKAKKVEIAKRSSFPINCTFCGKEFKAEGWLKNHITSTHSLPVSIPLSKLSKPLPVRAYLRKPK